MPITEILVRNATFYPGDTALVEINAALEPTEKLTWKEYSLMQSTGGESYRREMTWSDFDMRANRFANLLLTRGIQKGQKVAILLMNCLEWLPVYFGILKAGGVAVPLNFRYTADEIKYCLQKSDSEFLVFGPEFTGRVEEICSSLPQIRMWSYVGRDCPSFAESYDRLVTFVYVETILNFHLATFDRVCI